MSRGIPGHMPNHVNYKHNRTFNYNFKCIFITKIANVRCTKPLFFLGFIDNLKKFYKRNKKLKGCLHELC